MKADAFPFDIPHRKVGVAEVAVADLIPPTRDEVIQVMGHAADRAALRKPKVMKLPRGPHGIDHIVK